MKYGYARVSTVGQDLETQVKRLKQEGCEKIFKEKITGTKGERPQFKKLIGQLEKGDRLVITKLDRFARSTKDGIETIENLFKKGVSVHVLNMGLVEDSPTGRLILNIMLSFAEFERDMIVERTQEGKALARLKDGFKEGRPKKYKRAQVDHALKLLKKNSYKEVEALTGISISTLTRAKRARKNNL